MRESEPVYAKGSTDKDSAFDVRLVSPPFSFLIFASPGFFGFRKQTHRVSLRQGFGERSEEK